MLTIRRTLAILVAVLLFPVLFLPQPESSLFVLLKICLFGAVLFTLYLAVFPEVSLSDIQFLSSGEPSENVNKTIRKEVGKEYDGLIDLIIKIVESVNPKYNMAIYILSPGSQSFAVQKSSGSLFSPEVNQENEILHSVTNSTSGVVIQRKDAGEDWNALLDGKSWRGSETLLGSPISFRGMPVGCLIVYVDHFSEVHEQDSGIISGLSTLFSNGMDHIEKIEKLSMDSYYLERIAGMVSSVDIRTDDDHLWDGITHLCRSLFSYDKLSLSILEKDSQMAAVKLVDGMTEDMHSGESFNIQTTLHGRPIREKETIISSYWENDYQDSGRFKPGDSSIYHFMSILAAPIRINGEIRGSIALEKLSTKGYSEADRHLLEFLALNLEGILSWMEEYQLLHQSAIHDGLTDLLNHAAFKERFEEEVSRASRFNQFLTLAVLDLDKFKRINDSYGHLYGDYVLRTVARIIDTSVRTIDVVGRYGGEEFAILLINTDKEQALPVAQRIVDSIADHAFSKDGIDESMTISAGMAEFPTDTDQIRDLIAKADKAMYQSKSNGGNNVTCWGDANATSPPSIAKGSDA
jgi:diguanylate cyclase (GGDEF)-like protein